jgi:hypothetical protein
MVLCGCGVILVRLRHGSAMVSARGRIGVVWCWCVFWHSVGMVLAWLWYGANMILERF